MNNYNMFYFQEADKMSTVDKIYGNIAWRILSIAYEPGVFLNESALAAEYHVSRTPVREALRRLQQEGWLVMIPNVGMQVAPIDLWQLKGLYSTKEALEKLVMEQALLKMTEEDAKALEDALQVVKDTDEKDITAITNADGNFHFTLWKLAKNDIAFRYLYDMQEKLYRFWHYALKNGASVEKAKLIEALSICAECIIHGQSEKIPQAVAAYINYHKNQMEQCMF